MNQILLVGAGGFIGAVLRFLVGGWVQRCCATFPLGTLAVNFTGSFALGLVMYLSEYRGFFDQETRIFLTIGLLGAYTTMSTFSYESFRLLEQDQAGLFLLNALGTLALTLLAVYAAKIIAINL